MNRDSETDRDGIRRIVDFQAPESVETQAARWLALLDSDDLPQQKVDEFKAWINQSETHREAFEALLSLWDEMNILTQTVPPRRKMDHRSSIMASWPRRLATCWSLVVLAVLMLALVVVPVPKAAIYVTEIGEQRTIELPDGTSVLLNTNTWLKVDYDDELRSVQIDRGEALFKIAKDPQRPFEVHAGDGIIRALGTAFTVRLRDTDIEVLVTEGLVEIEKKQPTPIAINEKPIERKGRTAEQTGVMIAVPPPEKPLAQVAAGTSAVFGRNDFDALELAQIELLRMEAQLAWRHGVLAFDQEPLENVVEEMARYTSLKLVIPDKALREMKVGGIFKLGDTEAMFEALQQGFGISTARVSEDLVYLIADDNY